MKGRFPEVDLDEIYEILREFKKPFIYLVESRMDDRQIEDMDGEC